MPISSRRPVRADSPDPGLDRAGGAAAGAAAPGRGAPAGPAAPAWYAHGFNSTASLRLILGIIPRLPRFLVPPIGVATTAVCMAFMRRERQAVRRNQSRILGASGARLARAVWRQFYGFSRHMVSYCDLMRPDDGSLDDRLAAGPGDEERIRAALAPGRGLVVLTAHLGNWEAGARFLGRFGVPVNIVMRADRASGAERWLMRRRGSGPVRVLRSGAGPTTLLHAQAALERGEIVAVQGDRILGERAIEVRLFGAPFRVPLGPFLLAARSGAPILTAFVVQEGWWRWRAEVGGALRLEGASGRRDDLAGAAAQYAAQLEAIVRRHPDQWFNFFDIWGSEDTGR